MHEGNILKHVAGSTIRTDIAITEFANKSDFLCSRITADPVILAAARTASFTSSAFFAFAASPRDGQAINMNASTSTTALHSV